MSESSLLGLLLTTGLGGTALFFIVAGAIMVGLIFFTLLIISDFILSAKENVVSDN